LHPTFFQLGSLHIPIFGVVAAIGLMAALALCQRTARYASLDPTALWDAGLTGMIAAFVISRLLLIVFNFHSFLTYPVLLMAVPSLTSTGILLTAAFMVLYLRRKRLPLLAVLDASAPCAALIWAFVNLGRIAEGTKDGMPSTLPWAIAAGMPSPMPGSMPGSMYSAMHAGVHPVELYTVLVALALCALLFSLLRRRDYTGRTTALGLLTAGVAVFFLDFFRLPSDLFPDSHTAWLDPAQVLALGMILVGSVLVFRGPSKHQEADRIGAGNAF
jgi:phosphatidylglycerol:prolipoprotein diacylglycerol transferase